MNQSWKWQRQAVVPRWQQWVCKMHFSFLVAWLGSNYWCTYSWANCSKPTRRRGAGWCWLWWSKNGWSSTETGRWCRTPQTFIWWENALWNSQEQLWKDQGRVPQVSSDHFFRSSSFFPMMHFCCRNPPLIHFYFRWCAKRDSLSF